MATFAEVAKRSLKKAPRGEPGRDGAGEGPFPAAETPTRSALNMRDMGGPRQPTATPLLRPGPPQLVECYRKGRHPMQGAVEPRLAEFYALPESPVSVTTDAAVWFGCAATPAGVVADHATQRCCCRR